MMLNSINNSILTSQSAIRLNSTRCWADLAARLTCAGVATGALCATGRPDRRGQINKQMRSISSGGRFGFTWLSAGGGSGLESCLARLGSVAEKSGAHGSQLALLGCQAGISRRGGSCATSGLNWTRARASGTSSWPRAYLHVQVVCDKVQSSNFFHNLSLLVVLCGAAS